MFKLSETNLDVFEELQLLDSLRTQLEERLSMSIRSVSLDGSELVVSGLEAERKYLRMGMSKYVCRSMTQLVCVLFQFVCMSTVS